MDESLVKRFDIPTSIASRHGLGEIRLVIDTVDRLIQIEQSNIQGPDDVIFIPIDLWTDINAAVRTMADQLKS